MSSITEQIFPPSQNQVTLDQMLETRERRAVCQRRLIQKYGKPIISFTMNIAGPVKVTPAIARAFYEGCGQIERVLKGKHMAMLCFEKKQEDTGCQALYSVDANAAELKRLCMWIENNHALGRLYDIDVIAADGRPMSRETLGGGERGCMLCGAPGRACASRRIHMPGELQERTGSMLYSYFLARDARNVMSLAAKCLRLEAWTTPKPGLVDMNNSGSHSDMDMYTLMRSISALAQYFQRFFEIGVETAGMDVDSAFLCLREAGVQAEAAMLEATDGVNTHKGAIFLMGTVCGACGRLWKPSGLCRDATLVMDMCAELAGGTLRRELALLTPETAVSFGERLYVEHGIAGARGQIMEGLPAVRDTALPYLKRLTDSGKKLQEAGVVTLLHLIADVCDTNMIRRGGLERQRRAADRTAQLLRAEPFPSAREICELDREFIRDNLSPGGCADLLAVAYFLFLLEGAD